MPIGAFHDARLVRAFATNCWTLLLEALAALAARGTPAPCGCGPPAVPGLRLWRDRPSSLRVLAAWPQDRALPVWRPLSARSTIGGAVCLVVM